MPYGFMQDVPADEAMYRQIRACSRPRLRKGWWPTW